MIKIKVSTTKGTPVPDKHYKKCTKAEIKKAAEEQRQERKWARLTQPSE